ncbi:unnamed protein product [Porites evermanni]|uniref:Uncharacterized protein n=1 Tax=Porites evermanni TaxID=104178 RepID=A0ABN8L9J3_9CNID|nr:unnamed protein product [Porites evermanni]
MASVKVLLFLFGSMLILTQFHKSSAASLVENLDAEDETLDDKEGVTKKDETFDVTDFEAKDDLNGLEDVDKRRALRLRQLRVKFISRVVKESSDTLFPGQEKYVLEFISEL